MLLATEPINAIATEPADTLGARIAVFQHAQPPATCTVYLDRLAGEGWGGVIG